MSAGEMTSDYRISGGNHYAEMDDVRHFISTVNSFADNDSSLAQSLFNREEEIIIARAPGRLDVMGGIGDYSGSLVLQMPIREATLVGIQLNSGTNNLRELRIVSLSADDARENEFEMALDEFERDGKLIDYATAREFFKRDERRSWAAYVAGVFLVLMRERGARFNIGARLLIDSEVPEGSGVSSSAAVEVATMQAVAAAFEIKLDARELALLCQKVENFVVGAPCGVMDQMASACGEPDALLALLCQPAELQGTIKLPDDLAVWGVDSGVRHSIGAGDYRSVRTGAFIGYRIIAEIAGLRATPRADKAEMVTIDDPRWRNYLSNVTPSEFEQFFSARVPERIKGAEFIARYQGTTDAVTQVEKEREYAVHKPTAHAIYENFRVQTFAGLLRAANDEGRQASWQTARRNQLLGELMYQSHASYSACGLGSEGTDLLVELVRKRGAANGLYGAKITGGGSGGTVAILGRRESGSAIMEIAAEYAAQTDCRPRIFRGSSPGASAFGHLRLRLS